LGKRGHVIDPPFQDDAELIDKVATAGVGVRCRRAESAQHAMDHPVGVEILLRRDSIVVCVYEWGEVRPEHEGATRA
jgi:hypothetical protein